MNVDQELARAENQLRAMLSPDTPAPSSSEVRTMRRKIADLKSGKMPSATGASMATPPPPPTSNAAANGQEMRDPRKELERLKRENEALLQLKELEMENLKLKNAPQADLEKKQQEMTMLLQKKQELAHIMELEENVRAKALAQKDQKAAAAKADEVAKQELESMQKQEAQQAAQAAAEATAEQLEAESLAAAAAAEESAEAQVLSAQMEAKTEAESLAQAEAAAAQAEAEAQTQAQRAAEIDAMAAQAAAEAEAAYLAEAERKANEVEQRKATTLSEEDEEAAMLAAAFGGAEEKELVTANVGAQEAEAGIEDFEAAALVTGDVGSMEHIRKKEAQERAKAEAKAAADAAARAARAAMENAEAIKGATGAYKDKADVYKSADAEAAAAADARAKAIAEAKAKALGAAKAELARLQVVNKAETSSKLRARNALTNQTLVLGAEAKAKMAADSIAEAQSATEMAAASEISAVAERGALEAAVAVIKAIETAEEMAVIKRQIENEATEAKAAIDVLTSADPDAFRAHAAQVAHEKYEADLAAAEKAAADKQIAEKAATDRATSAKAAVEKAIFDKNDAETKAGKAIADDAAAKEAAAEEAAAAKAAAEEAASAKAEAERIAAEKKAEEEAEAAATAAVAARLEEMRQKAEDDPLGACQEIEKLVESGEGNAEDWAEARRQAEETIGHLLNVCRAGTKPKLGEVWHLEPSQPVPGEKITIYYNAAATCLAGVKQYGSITCQSGCNNWEFPEKTQMTPVKGRFKVNGKAVKAVKGSWWQKCEVDIPEEAFVMDFVFSDGGHEYDNNNREDYHCACDGAEEILEVERYEKSADLYYQLVEDRIVREKRAKERKERRDFLRGIAKAKAAEVTRRQREHVLYVDPPEPRAGQTVRVHYNPRNTNLAASNEVYIIGGWNRWTHPDNIGPIKMVGQEGQSHVSAEFTVPDDTFKMDFVFASKPDGKGAFDNNNRLDYHVDIKGGVDKVTGEKLMEPALHIMSISVEMAPIAKVGGLGDVVTSLARACQEEGHKVEVVLPKYDTLDYTSIQDFTEITGFSWGATYNRVYHGKVEDIDTYFIDPENGMFRVGMIYGTDYLEIPMTDAERFGFFSKAALEFMLQTKRQPDIIHAHDWQTAACAKAYWEDYAPYGLNNPRVVFTIHNLNYGAELIQEAMTYSQAATTVSRTYRDEVAGHESIQENIGKFHGVVNGIDPDIWDPANDDFLPRYYDETEVIEGKAACREALCAYSNIPNKPGVPMVGIVTRLTPQKGVHLIRRGILRALERGCQVILLGTAPDPTIQQDFDMMFHELKQNHHDFMAFHLYYNEPLSHLIYAGSDLLLVPSMFEPCGLSQLIAMRYGTVPVVRRTGGLNDTVFDYDVDHKKAEWEGMKPNGFSFDGTDDGAIDFALDRAINLAYDKPKDFRALQANCMSQDWSWNRPALEYIEIYHAARKPY